MRMNFEKMNDKAVIPTRGTEHSAGLDLTATGFEIVAEGADGVVKFFTGLKCEIPAGHFGAIYMRSGLAKKGKWSLANAVGVIDSDYRGELIVMLRFVAGIRFRVPRIDQDSINALIGNRIAQLVIQPYVDVKAREGVISTTERGENGFGHTGS